MNLDIQNFTTSPINNEFVRKVIHSVLKFEGINDTISIGIVFVGHGRMREINKKYNKKNRITDVLSFAGERNFVVPPGTKRYLGEIIICLPVVKKEAARVGKSFEWEFSHILIHGTLHLLGHEHEKSSQAARKMHAREEKIISSIVAF